MKKVTFVWVIISLFVGVVCYLTSLNLILAILTFGIYLFYYFLFARKRFKKYYTQIDRIHGCYHFINSFLVTLSIKESYDEAYESAMRIESKNLKEEDAQISKLNAIEKVNYLRNYFNLAIYRMFLNVLDLYQDQGGNILNMSDNLIRECTRTEKTLNETLTIGRKHIVEFGLLWIMSFGIVLFMRFGVSEFYLLMVKEVLFVIMLFVFFMICLVSIHLFLNKYTDLTIKEDNGDEQIA